MDYQKFITELPNFYDNWRKETVSLKSRRFQNFLEIFPDTTTENIMQLLNFAVECLDEEEIYCQVGGLTGANLFAALSEHPHGLAYLVDDFSCREENQEIINKLNYNLANFDLENQVVIANQSVAEFFSELRQFHSEEKIGIYFYQGEDNYRSQFLGLQLAQNFLADKAVIIINNANYIGVQQAIWDFMTVNPQCEKLLSLLTPAENHPSFDNGIEILSWDITKENNYTISEINKYNQDNFISALVEKEREFNQQRKAFFQLRREAILLHGYECFEEAEKKYLELLDVDAKQAGLWLNLGTLYYQTHRYQEAINALAKAIDLEPSQAVHYYTIGVVLEKAGAHSHAIEAYQRAIAIEPEAVDPYNNLGNIFLEAGDLDQAESVYRQAIAVNPKHFGSYLNLGNVLMERQEIDAAVEIYEQALCLKPRNPDILYNLGVALEAKNDPAESASYYGYAHYRKNEFQEALNYFQEFTKFKQGDEHFYIALAQCYQGLNQVDLAISAYQEGLKIYPKSKDLYIFFGTTLQDVGKPEAAIQLMDEAVQVMPDVVTFKLERQRILPILYEQVADIADYRQRFAQGLADLVSSSALDTPEARKNALFGISFRTNFYLQYQCQNDIELQQLYGNFVHQVMAANYPEWAKPLPIKSLQPGEKIRVGYASYYLRNHNGARWALGWINHHDRQDIEIYCYHTAPEMDQITQQFKLSSNVFHHIPNDLEAVCEQIIQDKLHILIFPDIGMAPITTQMAGLRLAPVQCTAWGHPITSGLPTIDYYISGDLMEPENAQEHYSEQLIRLPNIGLCYPKPVVPQLTSTRADFNLREDAIVYLSCQSLFKYLPQYDDIYPAIATKVPTAQFAFLAHKSVHITEQFRQRLQRAFAKYGLDSETYCVIAPRQNTKGYLTLNLLSDVYLDTFGWSGGNSTLEAIACNLPIVTCPGEYMRGMHSYAILKILGVTDTIAYSQEEYVDIAVKLGSNPELRQEIIQRMTERHDYLYSDKSCVTALDNFFRQVTGKK
ncbi:tetratricopeptide repeat protein [Calothrix sp. 336/3]|uniref:tetratricopeptide repeat protein n=1 Tax=Calothrix sp. 336/3 TaxID=1337936 RepID=UPI0004E41054|nr:tetratricopeptide repeat protein [Calothrix sp. 336/3]AKG23316.1 hypothetical protein IJ00_20345 [Calothrix sp. 336/3]